MTNIEMITDVSQQKAQQLVSQYRQLAQHMGQNDTDFLKGAEENLRSGLSDADTKTMLKQTAIGASISGDTNEQMSENLITMKDSYNLTANEIGNLVDKLSTLDNKSSTSFDGIIEGMKRSAASAQQVGVQYDKLAAYITTVESVSHRSASTIGESFKSIFSRLTNVSAGANDEDGIGINQVEQVLEKQGIAIRETSGQWRNMGDVIDDIGKRWKSFDSVTQSQIATVVAGKQQMTSFLTLMQNYDKEQQYEADQQNAQGSAWKKYQDYLNSTEAKVNSFKTSLHTLYSDLANSTTINQAVSAGQGFVEFLDYITTKNPIAGAGIGALSTAFIRLAAAMKSGAYASFLKDMSDVKSAFIIDAAEMGTMTAATGLLSAGLTGVATAGKAAMGALLFNPLTWIGVAIAGVVEITSHLQQQKEEFQKLDDAVKQYKEDLAKNDPVALTQDQKAMQDEQKQLDDLIAKYNQINQSKGKNTGNIGIAVANGAKQNLDDYINTLEKVGLHVDRNTGKIKELKTIQDQLGADNILATAQRELQSNTDALNSDTGKLISTYIQLSTQQNKGALESQQQTDVVNQLTKIYPNLKTGVDSAGNSIITNTDVLTQNTEALINNQGAVNGTKTQLLSLSQIESNLGDAVSKAKSNIDNINSVLQKHQQTGEWDYNTIISLAKAYPDLLTAMGDDKTLTEALTSDKQKEIDTVENSLKQQIALEQQRLQAMIDVYGVDISRYGSAEAAKTAVLQAEVNKRIQILQTEIDAYTAEAKAAVDAADKETSDFAADKDAQVYTQNMQRVDQLKKNLSDLQNNKLKLSDIDPSVNSAIDDYYSMKKMIDGTTKVLSGAGNPNNDGKKNSNSQANDALTAQQRDIANKSRDLDIQSRNLEAESKALDAQSRALNAEKQNVLNVLDNQYKAEQQHMDDVIKGYNKELDALQKKKDLMDATNQALDYEDKIKKDQALLDNAQSQKNVYMYQNGQWTWEADYAKIQQLQEQLAQDQKDYSRWQADQAITNQENAIKDQIQATQDQKDAQTRAYNNQKDTLEQTYQAKLDAIDTQKQDVSNSQQDISNARSDLDQQKNSINDQRNTLAGYADGTNNATPGPHPVAENGIEIVIGNQVRNFVGREQVLNNAQTMNLVNGGNSSSLGSNSNSASQQAKNTLNSVGQTIDDNKQLVERPVNELLNDLDNKNQSFVDQSPQYAINTSKNIETAIIDNKQLITSPMDKVIQEVKNQCQQFVDGAGQYAKNSNNNIGTSITGTADSVYNPTKTLISNVKKLLDDFVASTINDGKGIDTQLGQGITDGEGELDKIIGDLTNKIITKFRTDFGIHSPSTVMHEIGGFLIQGLINGMNEADIEKFISEKTSGMTDIINNQVANVPGSLTDWIKQAMQLTNTPDSWLPYLQTIAMKESSGDPTNVNTYDINAQEGHPSKGIMQMIDSSFQENMLPNHNQIFNPIDNIASAINYIRKRYSDVTRVPGIVSMSHGGPYVGYKTGTEYVPKTDFYNINEDSPNGAETVVLPEGAGVVNGNNTHQLNVLAENAPSLVDALRDDIKVNNAVQDMYSKWVQPSSNIDYNNIYAQGANVNRIPVMNQTQNIDKSDNRTIRIDHVDLPNVQNGDDFVNDVTRWVNTHI